MTVTLEVRVSDIEDTVDHVAGLIKKGCFAGENSNDHASFDFTSAGEFEEPSEYLANFEGREQCGNPGRELSRRRRR
jgi:hypothetical protein